MGTFVKTYTPKETVMYENNVAACFRAAVGSFQPHDGPVRMRISAYFIHPKSWPTWKVKAYKSLPHTTKPDGDNIEKAVKDGLDGIAFTNDSRVFKTFMEKAYDNTPRVDVTIDLFKEPCKNDFCIL